MENLFSMWKVRELADKVTNVVMNYTEIEAKVREATNDEPWGPTGQIMQELAHSTFTYEHFPEVMSMLWKRMFQDNKQHWRRIYKALLVLNYLVKNGSERVVTSAREHIYDLRSLENFSFIDDMGKDQGVNIRHKVKELIDFIQDDDRLREERKKAKKNKDKYIGMSSDMVGMRLGSHERWDDKPRDYGDHDWEEPSSGASRYRDRSFDDEYDIDKEDSDTESARNHTSRKYKDNDPSPTEKRVNININSAITNTPKKSTKPIKKVDLGAAANFGRDASQSPLPQASDLIDDFNPRAEEEEKKSTEFGDFEAAFGSNATTTPKSDDDFADFSSAFSQNNTDANLMNQNQNLFMPNVIPPPNLGIQPPIGGLMGAQAPVMAAKPQNSNDLLGDLSGFSGLSIQPPGGFGNVPNNNQGLVGAAPSLLDGDPVREVLCDRDSGKNSVEKQLRDASATVVNKLNKIKKISSQSDIDDIINSLDKFLPLLPTLTVQKLLEIDSTDLSHYADREFRNLLENLIAKFDQNFPLIGGQVYKEVKVVFSVEDYHFFRVTCDVIVKNLKTNLKILNSLSVLAEIALKSEGCFALIWHNFFTKEEDLWQNDVKILITFPNRISNALQGQFNQFFKPNEYSKFLVFNVIKVIEFSTDLLLREPKYEKNFYYTNLALFLSKTLINYNEHYNSGAIKTFVKVANILTNQKSDKLNVYRTVFWNLFESLERSAVEILAVTVLQNTDPSVYTIKSVLGPNLIKCDNWKYVLCTKIPLLSHYDNENLIKNLIVYLSATSEHNLFTLLVNLITVWSDKSALNHTSVEHHLYLTKLIVVIINSFKNIGLSEHQRQILQSKMYSGVPVHLENSTPSVRAMGMKVSEIVLNFIQTESEKSETLRFEFDQMPNEGKEVGEILQKLFDTDMTIYFKNKDVEEDVFPLISSLLEAEKCPEYVPPARQLRGQEEPKNVVVAEAIHQKNNLLTIVDSTDFELDSDDDLEPYDLANDVKVSKKEPPKYLRDLRDGLLETQDCDVFSLSLEACEDLIIKQLPDDDVSLGVELLQILVGLDQRFYVENFDSVVFKSCVAITCVYPSQSAEYLCKWFHADVGTYSISHRIFLLDVLSEASRNLSALTLDKPDEKIVIKRRKKNPDLEKAEEIIKKRLESKTRYFHKHKAFRVEKLNKFAQVAGHFFFPLLYGYNGNKMISQIPQNDSDFILLIHFIRTLSVIMCSSQNCPIEPRMAKEVLHFSWYLRFHKEVKVRIAVIGLIGAAVINTPKEILMSDFTSELLEFRLWLGDLLSLSVTRGEPNSECRSLAASTMCIIDSFLKVDDE
ncbi:epsin-like protein isoform X1 [Tribolium castaneum]|uniref:Epsin-like protein n=1 Tax=Tribolium castaneum TaxID=7070 RepID=A0A139WCC3_TRICA|nr:PREDICTED: epsin-like protein isoform X1 [Tribolium castaneum]KYB25481.1 epsin-like protein [Tribolium castaneum]|eukprot:XP_008197529.1 PREDICTED: epsin-like protein isoform X1 [Tribolium castaneum]